MTETTMYGGNYQRCGRCSLKRPPSALVAFDAGAGPYLVCKETEKCAEWEATLAKATPADLLKVSK